MPTFAHHEYISTALICKSNDLKYSHKPLAGRAASRRSDPMVRSTFGHRVNYAFESLIPRCENSQVLHRLIWPEIRNVRDDILLHDIICDSQVVKMRFSMLRFQNFKLEVWVCKSLLLFDLKLSNMRKALHTRVLSHLQPHSLVMIKCKDGGFSFYIPISRIC